MLPCRIVTDWLRASVVLARAIEGNVAIGKGLIAVTTKPYTRPTSPASAAGFVSQARPLRTAHTIGDIRAGPIYRPTKSRTVLNRLVKLPVLGT